MGYQFPPRICLLCKNFIVDDDPVADAERWKETEKILNSGNKKDFEKIVNLPPSCKAFPKGIPEPIMKNRHDHKTAYPGDHGIQFEPFDNK